MSSPTDGAHRGTNHEALASTLEVNHNEFTASASVPRAAPSSVTISSGVSAKRKTEATPWSHTVTTSRTRRRRGCWLGARSLGSSSSSSGAAHPHVSTTAASNILEIALVGASSNSYTSACSARNVMRSEPSALAGIPSGSTTVIPYSRAADRSKRSSDRCRLCSTHVARSSGVG